MWREIFGAAKRLYDLDRRIEQNRSDITELQRQIRDLSAATTHFTLELERLNGELQRFRENEAREREMLVLRLENTLLRLERGLPPSSSSETE